MSVLTYQAVAAYEGSEWRWPDLCGGGAMEARMEDFSPASEQFIGRIDHKVPTWT